ncbi:MAG: hypothetical protein J6L61_09665 [Ruminiclostridium sp.]|nr:hypothetical protein [Ruminiclostridium sp.]
MKKKKHLFTVLLLAISLLSTSIPVYAQENGNADNENSTSEESFEEADRNLLKDLKPGDLSLVELSDKELDDYEIPEVISAKDIKEKEHANRLFAQETDDYSIVFQNKDGSKTMYYFDEPVKYTDENGTVCDKSTKLSEADKDGYAFVSAENDINVYMPKQLDSETGIIVKSNEYTIEMSPVDSDKADVSDIIAETQNKYDEHDIVEYINVFGKDTTIEYSAQLNGVKENIILDRYNGKNEFSFDVDTNGLSLKDEDGYFSIVDDEKAEIVGAVSEVILFDSSKGENTIVPQGYVTGYTAVKNADGNYTITITLDNEWLKNEAVYPVTIDPTIKLSSSGSGSSKTILDAPLYSKKSTTNFGSYSIGTVGYQDSTYGAGRLIVRFPGLDSNATYKSLKANEIESAKLYMYEGTGNSGTSTLQVRYSSQTSGWAETAPTYANTSASGSVMSTTKISKSGSYAFDFTKLAVNSKNSKNDIKKGIVITNTNVTDSSLRRSFYMTEYSSSKPRVVVEWNPLVDGMAYVFKTSSSKCIGRFEDSISENNITTNGYNSNEYINPDQIWITKKSLAGGYLIYSAKNSSDAICATPNASVAIYKCTSETNLYYCWDFERITSSTYAIKNKYSSKWLYKKSDGSLALTDNQANRLILTKATSNYPSSWKGGYSGQSGTYKLNIIFSNQTDYNDLAKAAEAWNGICDKVCVKAYPPNSNPSTGLNVTVARKNLSTAGIENSSKAYAVFLPNSTTTNYLKTQEDIGAENQKNWSKGVIFINQDKKGFYSLNSEKQNSSIMHEVGHALKLCHSDDTTSQGNRFGIVTLMSNDSSTVNKDITLYDKASLIKKWRDMP